LQPGILININPILQLPLHEPHVFDLTPIKVAYEDRMPGVSGPKAFKFKINTIIAYALFPRLTGGLLPI